MKKISKFITLIAASALLIPGTLAKYTDQTSYHMKVVTTPPQISSEFFPYTGRTASYMAQQDGYYAIQAWGGAGGNGRSNNASGGAGAYVAGYIQLNQGQTLTVTVGGKGGNGSASAGSGGYNGGGAGASYTFSGGGGGGGATDIRLGGTGVDNRILVAAGGGGGGATSSGGKGGNGGTGNMAEDSQAIVSGYYISGADGTRGSGKDGSQGTGGTAVGGGRGNAVFSSNSGKSGSANSGGAGGGRGGGAGSGYFGGGGGGSTGSLTDYAPGGGGGGSSFIARSVGSQIPDAITSILPHAQDSTGYTEGNGYCIITFIGENLPSNVAITFNLMKQIAAPFQAEMGEEDIPETETQELETDAEEEISDTPPEMQKDNEIEEENVREIEEQSDSDTVVEEPAQEITPQLPEENITSGLEQNQEQEETDSP